MGIKHDQFLFSISEYQEPLSHVTNTSLCLISPYHEPIVTVPTPSYC